MSDAEARHAGGDELGPDVVELARALRSELRSLNEGELRRQARLVAFNQQMAEMEGSIHREVERLRTTGSVVELLADLLRQSLGDLENDHRFEPIQEELTRLREDVAALPAPDDQRVMGAIAALTDRLERLDRSVAALQDRELLSSISERLVDLGGQVQSLVLPDLTPLQHGLDGLREQVTALPRPDLEPLQADLVSGLTTVHDKLDALPTVDLEPLREQLDHLHLRLAAIPTRDLRPIHDRIEALAAAITALPAPDDRELREELQGMRATIESLPVPDLAPVEARLMALQRQLDALPPVDLEPLQAQLMALQSQVGDLPAPDDSAVQAAVSGVAERLGDLRRAVDELPAAGTVQGVAQEVATLSELVGAIPVYEDGVVRAELGTLAAQVESLRTAMADRFDALPGPAAVADLLTPGMDAIRDLTDPGPVLSALEHVSRDLVARIDRLPNHTDRLDDLASAREALDRDLAQITTVLADVAERTRPISAIESGLAALRDAIERLEAATDANVAGGREAADAQALALARVTAATDGFASTVGTLRTAMATAAQHAGEETVAALEERLEARLRAFDPEPLDERLRAIDDRMSALPLPDLSPVAAQLARLTATLTSEARVRPATASQVDAVATSLGEATTNVLSRLASLAERVERAAAASEQAAELAREALQVARQPVPERASRATKKAAPTKAAAKKAAEKAAEKQTTSKGATPRADQDDSALDEG